MNFYLNLKRTCRTTTTTTTTITTPPPPPTTTTATPTTTTTSGGGGCFPASGYVLLENGRSVTMSELQLGDQVQTGIDSQNKIAFKNHYLLS